MHMCDLRFTTWRYILWAELQSIIKIIKQLSETMWNQLWILEKHLLINVVNTEHIVSYHGVNVQLQMNEFKNSVYIISDSL